ncbi:MAG TPA: gluconeogenesis factor YvcK family protein [Chloroflexota bacterium]
MFGSELGGDPNVVVIGGGTGIYAVLTGLRNYTSNIAAVVSMSDNGGSSGRLRDEFGYLPPGDVRRCLVALASDDDALLLRRLFEYRFERGLGLNGHTFGNLLLTALTDILGSADRAIEEAGSLLRIRGRVLPVTLGDTTLCARLADGHEIRGETDIDVRKAHHDVPISQVYLDPTAPANPAALEAIAQADLIVLGPGDLYTSVIPNLLIEGIPEAIRAASARRVYVCNVMTKHGETDGFAASDFIGEINRYLGGENTLDCAVLNYHESLPRDLYERYKSERSEPVSIDLGRCYESVNQLAIRPLTATGALVRHDPARLAETLVELLRDVDMLDTPPHLAIATG